MAQVLALIPPNMEKAKTMAGTKNGKSETKHRLNNSNGNENRLTKLQLAFGRNAFCAFYAPIFVSVYI